MCQPAVLHLRLQSGKGAMQGMCKFRPGGHRCWHSQLLSESCRVFTYSTIARVRRYGLLSLIGAAACFACDGNCLRSRHENSAALVVLPFVGSSCDRWYYGSRSWPHARHRWLPSRTQLRARECQGYSWEESGRYNEEVHIFVPLDRGEKAKNVDFELRNNTLRVGLRGREPTVSGDLWRSVEPEESDWTVDLHEGQRSIVVTLTKVNVREGWRHLLRHDGNPDELPGPEEVVSNKLDLSVLGQLDHVHALLQQKRLDEAREMMKIMTAEIKLPGDDDADEDVAEESESPSR